MGANLDFKARVFPHASGFEAFGVAEDFDTFAPGAITTGDEDEVGANRDGQAHLGLSGRPGMFPERLAFETKCENGVGAEVRESADPQERNFDRRTVPGGTMAGAPEKLAVSRSVRKPGRRLFEPPTLTMTLSSTCSGELEKPHSECQPRFREPHHAPIGARRS
jgi:hypothetical protein